MLPLIVAQMPPTAAFVHSGSPLRNAEQLLHLRLIVADDHVVLNADDRDTHLASHLNHFRTLLCIRCHVMVCECNIICSEKIFRCVTEVACWSAVDSDGFAHDVLFGVLIT